MTENKTVLKNCGRSEINYKLKKARLVRDQRRRWELLKIMEGIKKKEEEERKLFGEILEDERKKKQSRTRNPAEGWREERMEFGGRGVPVVFS